MDNTASLAAKTPKKKREWFKSKVRSAISFREESSKLPSSGASPPVASGDCTPAATASSVGVPERPVGHTEITSAEQVQRRDPTNRAHATEVQSLEFPQKKSSPVKNPLVTAGETTPSILPEKRQSQRVSSRDLWAIAVQELPVAEREGMLVNEQESKLDLLDRLSKEVKQQRNDCEKDKLRFKFRDQEVVLRDIADKAITWIDKFKAIGDTAVNFDPVHAALPWAGVRFLLQIAVVEKKQREYVLVVVEKILSITGRCKVLELLYLDTEVHDRSQRNLQSALVAIYTLILNFLNTTRRLDRKGYTLKTLHAILNPDEGSNFLEDCERLERNLDSETSNCQGVLARADREVNDDTARRVKHLQNVLQAFWEPLSHISSKVAFMFLKLEQSRQSEILQWISSITYMADHATARRGRTLDTGFWLLRDSRFRRWLNSKSSMILWLHGRPGAGKTTLVSTVLDHLHDGFGDRPSEVIHGREDSEALAYFYCDRNRPDHQNPTFILSSLVRQLSLSRNGDAIHASTLQIYDRKQKTAFASGGLSYDEAQTQIEALVKSYTQTIIVLDALDECDQKARVGLLHYLQQLVSRSLGSSNLVKVFVSSRHDSDIDDILSSELNRAIEATDNQEDIVTYVNSSITHDESPYFWRKKISRELRQRVYNVLIDKAEGNFQWVALQIQELHTLSSNKDVERRLGKLPKTLEKAYDEVFDRIKNAEEYSSGIAIRAFKWVMCSQEPMSPDILVKVVCQDPLTDEMNDLVDIDIHIVIDKCHNLLAVDSSGKVCRFSHLSVQEYLEAQDWRPHCLVAQICLKSLIDSGKSGYSALRTRSLVGRDAERKGDETFNNSSGYENNDVDDDFNKFSVSEVDEASDDSGDSLEGNKGSDDSDNRFRDQYEANNGLDDSDIQFRDIYEYASHQWVFHVQVCGEVDLDSCLETLLRRFLGSPTKTSNAYRRWCSNLISLPLARLLQQSKGSDTERDVRRFTRSLRPVSMLSLPIAMFGFHNVLSDWWECIQFEQRNEYEESLLVVAARGGCASTVEVLLRENIDVNAFGNEYEAQTALYAAVGSGNEATVKMLLDAKAEVNFTSPYRHNYMGSQKYGNALQAAAAACNTALVKMLLASGADVNKQGGYYETALQAAADGGINRLPTVRMLLEAGAHVDVNSRNNGDTNSALLRAILNQSDASDAIVQLLLEKGANPNVRHLVHGFPLMIASIHNNKNQVRMLLDAGADVNAQHRDRSSALSVAVYQDGEALVRLLIDAGADVNVQIEDYGSALNKASSKGHEALVRLLIDAGADVNARGRYGSILNEAVYKAHAAVVRLLLDAGADVSRIGSGNKSTVAIAFAKGHFDIVRLLVTMGPSVEDLLAEVSAELLELLPSLIYPDEALAILLHQIGEFECDGGTMQTLMKEGREVVRVEMRKLSAERHNLNLPRWRSTEFNEAINNLQRLNLDSDSSELGEDPVSACGM